MNVLAIGNSFSENGTVYLHQIAESDNTNITVVNLSIGGCPLSRHYRNMLADAKAYPMYFNGASTGFTVSMKEALLSRQWNVVTLQQVSHKSPYYETYQPYLNELAQYVRKCQPHAKLMIHQTWPYEEGSWRLTQELGYLKQEDMAKDIFTSYQKAVDDICADDIIRCGENLVKLLFAGFPDLYTDSFHLNTLGCYAAGLVWYTTITEKKITEIEDCREVLGNQIPKETKQRIWDVLADSNES